MQHVIIIEKHLNWPMKSPLGHRTQITTKVDSRTVLLLSMQENAYSYQERSVLSTKALKRRGNRS